MRDRLANVRQAWHYALATAAERRLLAQRFPGSRFESGARVVHPERLTLGERVLVQAGALLHCGGGAWAGGEGEIVLGDETVIGHHAVLYGAGTIAAGPRLHVGPGAMIVSHTELLPASRTPAGPHVELGPVRIGSDVTLFAGCIIRPGVTLGDGAAIAAGAVVTRDVPDWELHAGVPARKLRDLERPSG